MQLAKFLGRVRSSDVFWLVGCCGHSTGGLEGSSCWLPTQEAVDFPTLWRRRRCDPGGADAIPRRSRSTLRLPHRHHLFTTQTAVRRRSWLEAGRHFPLSHDRLPIVGLTPRLPAQASAPSSVLGLQNERAHIHFTQTRRPPTLPPCYCCRRGQCSHGL